MTELGNYVQVLVVQLLEVVAPGNPPVIIVNVYDRHRENGERPAQMANWSAVAKSARVVIAGDMSAHSRMWNAQATRRRDAAFWEKLIEDEALVIWNSEEATRSSPEATYHSIIDLTLSSPNIELNWSIAGEKEATGSDHEVIQWEVIENTVGRGGTNQETTGWDISGWSAVGKTGEAKEATEQKRTAARECFLRAANRVPSPESRSDDASTATQVDGVAESLREAMTGTLDEHTMKKRWCSRSKRW